MQDIGLYVSQFILFFGIFPDFCNPCPAGRDVILLYAVGIRLGDVSFYSIEFADEAIAPCPSVLGIVLLGPDELGPDVVYVVELTPAYGIDDAFLLAQGD